VLILSSLPGVWALGLIMAWRRSGA
jgi:hypothetical protein